MPYRFNPSCCCPACYCVDTDILFLVDTTTSMLNATTQGEYDLLMQEFGLMLRHFLGSSCRWALADYKDFEDTDPDPAFADGWRVRTRFTDFETFVDVLHGTKLADAVTDIPEGTTSESEFDTDLTAPDGTYDGKLALFKTRETLAGTRFTIDTYVQAGGRITTRKKLPDIPDGTKLTIYDAFELSGSTDEPNQQFASLVNAAEQWTTTLAGSADPKRKRMILWAGDAPAWNGAAKAGLNYPTRQKVMDALRAANIVVFALNDQAGGDGIDGAAGADNEPRQSRSIVDATGGRHFDLALTDLSEASGNPSLRNVLCEMFAWRPNRARRRLAEVA